MFFVVRGVLQCLPMDTLSLTGKRWLLPETKPVLHSAQVMARLLAARNIDPHTMPALPSPKQYSGMQQAVERLERALQAGEQIGVFGDYDCDGVTAVAQVVRMLRRRGVEPFVRLPHRVWDGYGLNKKIVEECKEAHITLLITCDTGITSIKEIDALQQSGIDVIVTDHHHMQEELPPAYAILHPTLSTIPAPHPSGSGVAFSLVEAMEAHEWEGKTEDIALAMMGTVADLVPLNGVNRALTIHGLRALESIERGPLSELRERCRSNDAVMTSTDIAFRIAPRLNAAGRMAEADIALRALLDGGEALREIDALNEERQCASRQLCEQAQKECAQAPEMPLLFSMSGDYPHGIVGLIAGKLTEQFGKPSLIAHTDGRTCVASLRSPPCYNIAEALGRISDILDSYGGHAQAAGCTFSIAQADAVRERLMADVQTHCDSNHLKPTLAIDAELAPVDITMQFCSMLSLLEPYGQGNSEPLFLLRHVALHDARTCGSDNTHLQARIGSVKCIGFGLAHLLSRAETFDVVARVGINEWQGKVTPQLFLEDMRVAVREGAEESTVVSPL